jgi:hypothetical protein
MEELQSGKLSPQILAFFKSPFKSPEINEKTKKGQRPNEHRA